MTSTDSDENGDVIENTRTAMISSIARSDLAERIEPLSVVAEVMLTSPSARGSKYRVIVTNEMDEYDTPMPLTAMLVTTLAAARATGDSFKGTSRRASKLSIPNAPVEIFADLKELIETLPSDNAMKNHRPRIKNDKNSKRVAEEKRNVRLRVWLYAASREDDNDFHLILGRAPGATPKKFMTMELSGLPRSDSQHFARLKAARDAYKEFFGNNMPGGTYQFYDPPIPVEIEGALFFDISHASGSKPGPKKLRPDIPTVWELHPITSIVFEP